jgi:type I restriction enzyme S subunit
MSFSEWKKYKLSDVVEIKYGKDHKHLSIGEIPVYGSGGIMRFADKFLYDKESILIPRKGTLSNLFYLNRPFWSVDTMFYTKIIEGNNGKFLYYLLKSIDLASMNVGSAVPSLTTEILNKLEINLPNKTTQTKIANILSSIDDKIELNRQTNLTLETIAQTLFKEMCLPKSEELPDGWQETKLNEIIKVKHGYAFGGEFFSDIETDDILITPGNFKIGGGFNYSKFKYYNGKYPSDYILSEDDLIVTMTDLSKDGDSLGYSALVPTIVNKRLLHNQRIGKVDLKGKEIIKYFLYFTMRENNYRNFVLGSATGTTVRHTSPDRICDYNVKIPNDDLLINFNKIVQPILFQTRQNQKEINTLILLRDSLLPKLMKGEIEINNL